MELQKGHHFPTTVGKVQCIQLVASDPSGPEIKRRWRRGLVPPLGLQLLCPRPLPGPR